MTDLLVVGAGLFGSLIGRYAMTLGLSVRWVDSGDPRAASKCSSGLFREAWLGALSPDRRATAYEVLQHLARIDEVQLSAPGTAQAVVFGQTAPELILAQYRPELDSAVTIGRIEGDLRASPLFQEVNPRYVVLAAGVGLNDFTWPGKRKDFRVVGKAGVSFRWEGNALRPGRIAAWAPYKQTIVCPMPSGDTWGGDGTAIIASNWTEERVWKARKRVMELNGEGLLGHSTLFGHRPYVPLMKEGYLRKESPGMFVATGGAKIGTVMGAAMAREWAELAGVA